MEETLLEMLKHGNVILEAWPGYGKTRLGARVAASVERSLYVVRTHQEIQEVTRFAPILTPVYGKEKLCHRWQRGEDVSVYRFCSLQRLLGRCPYKYVAHHELVAWLAGRPRSVEEIRRKARELGVCPYPSMRVIADKAKRVVTTYGFVFTYPRILENRDVIVFDESHALLDQILAHVTVVDEVFVETLVSEFKRDIETRPLAYALRSAWRKSSTGREFIEKLERLVESAPSVPDIIEKLLDEYYRGRVYIDGKNIWFLPFKPSLPASGALFLTAYLPPFIMDFIPDAVLVTVPPPENMVVQAIIDGSVTSRYQERSPDTYEAYAQKITEYYAESYANLVIFPSYEFMNEVLPRLPKALQQRVKPPEAIHTAREGDIIVDVAGGVSTEGVNPPPTLRRVIVAGLPYPPPEPRLNLLSRIYGFDNVYTYLALLRVVQSIGRLRFRRGAVAVLLDSRFKRVQHYLPPYIKCGEVRVDNSMESVELRAVTAQGSG